MIYVVYGREGGFRGTSAVWLVRAFATGQEAANFAEELSRSVIELNNRFLRRESDGRWTRSWIDQRNGRPNVTYKQDIDRPKCVALDPRMSHATTYRVTSVCEEMDAPKRPTEL